MAHAQVGSGIRVKLDIFCKIPYSLSKLFWPDIESYRKYFNLLQTRQRKLFSLTLNGCYFIPYAFWGNFPHVLHRNLLDDVFLIVFSSSNYCSKCKILYNLAQPSTIYQTSSHLGLNYLLTVPLSFVDFFWP